MKKHFLFSCIVLLVCSELSFSQSIFSAGNWYKISVKEEGIYCLTYNDLISLGINVTSIDPRNISLYGNKSGMLPEQNFVPHPDEPEEMAIVVKGESDGAFNIGDSIFFYGQSQVERLVDTITKRFYHRQNIYSDSTFYFLTVKLSAGKRIQNRTSVPNFTNTVTKYTDFYYHENDSVNFLKSGQQWFGDQINALGSKDFNFDFTNASASDSLFIKAIPLVRSFSGINNYEISSNGSFKTVSLPNVVSTPQDDYVSKTTSILNISPPATIGSIHCYFSATDPTATSWLDYFELNFTRELNFYKPQQIFCDLKSVGIGSMTKFILQNTNSSLNIWDVTDPVNVINQEYNLSLSTTDFSAVNDQPHTFLAFDGNNYLIPQLNGQVPNQDLHSVTDAKLIIVTHEQFINEATILANFHTTTDGILSVVATTQQIYNEYSGGSQDPVAIRDFVRQVYNHTIISGDTLKYLLLFGSGSYDYKSKLGMFSSFVPTYQTVGSINQTMSTQTDDFYGYLSDSYNGILASTWVEIGIGRLPIRNINEALVINKIMNYNSPSSLGGWRKKIIKVADDGDHNVHLRQADTLATRLENAHCEYDLNKIYLDAYVIDTTGSILSYPDANYDLHKAANDGKLIISYTGHGSISGWAQERILEKEFARNLNNAYLPFYISATVDFNKFDNPMDTSAGEILCISDSGGGIASFGASRLAFSSSNFNLNSKLFNHVLDKENNENLRIGDIIKKTKTDFYSDPYVLNVCLLGDPAVKLNYPEHHVATTSINGQLVSTIPDTLIPGQSVLFEGEIQDNTGNLISSFNGIIEILVFDQKTLHYTLANTPLSSVSPFYEWDDTLHFGNATVSGGVFSHTFNLPWNLDSGSGIGKISYYAHNGITDASACYQNILFRNLTPGIDEIDNVVVNVYPNPSNGMIEINVKGVQVNDFTFSITDVQGQIVNVVSIDANRFVYDGTSLASGVYFFELINSKNRIVKRGKIVFQD
jgi:hypothetical protein